MENDGTFDRASAEAELASLHGQRAALADRATTPWWYDALPSLRGMVALYRRLTGFWVNGFRPGATRRAIAVWIVACLALLGLGSAAQDLWRGSMVVVAAVLAVVLFLVNRWWGRLYAAELRGAA